MSFEGYFKVWSAVSVNRNTWNESLRCSCVIFWHVLSYGAHVSF